MALGVVKNESSLAVTVESVEGTYVAPTSAADFLEVVSDGVELTLSRETIERNNLSATIEVQAPRVGQKSVSGTMPIEMKASSTEGNAPPSDRLFRSLLGGKRQLGAAITSKSSGHTSTSIKIEDADIGDFVVNGVYLFKLSTGYEVRPVTAIDDTPGSSAVTIPFAFEGGTATGAVVIAKMTQYFYDEGGPTLSATYYHGGEVEDKASGLRCVSASLDNWSTAQTAQWTFNVEGLDLQRDIAAPGYTPNFSGDALPPVLMGACVYLNGVEVQYNELSLSLENTKTDIASACSPDGKVGSRFTQFKASGSINPYMENDDTDRFDAFNLNDTVSVFGFAKNPGAVSGQDKEWCAFWIPNAKITEIPAGDVDGIMVDSISFQAFKSAGNDTVFLSFI
jgi:hypothetical protein